MIRWGRIHRILAEGDRAVQIRQCPSALEPRLPTVGLFGQHHLRITLVDQPSDPRIQVR
jgi:hypothetical protein